MNDVEHKTSGLSKAYDGETFRQIGHSLVDFLADHLDATKEGKGKTIQFDEPEVSYSFWEKYQLNDPLNFLKEITNQSIHIHHRKYIGHQVSPPLPLTALAGLVSDLLNNGMGIYEMGTAATTIEKIVIKKFIEYLGFDQTKSDGFLTSGGTLANLTALLGARSRYQEKSNQEPVILVSEQAHFCIERAAHTMGMGPDQLIKIPTDEEFRIKISALEKTIQEVFASNRGILAIVGCSCSTSTGSYDDLMSIAELCATYDIWMHVDGAHGGAVIFSEKYKSLCAGIELADSTIIDAHKMMMCPALTTAVVFKDAEYSYKALNVNADYLFREGNDWYNLAKRTYETTKYMMSIKVFLLFEYYGIRLVEEYINRQYELTRSFAQMIKNQDGFELAHEPMSNIVCFRYLTEDKKELNKINSFIRQSILNEGEFYIVQTRLRGDDYLRVTIMNPHTEEIELVQLLEKIQALGASSTSS